MLIGLPKEVKTLERRVALTPNAVGQLVHDGHIVMVEKDAGLLSGFNDDAYRSHGALVGNDVSDVWSQADLIVKVKEPVACEYDRILPNHTIFSYLHLAAEPTLTEVLKKSECTAIAFETVELPGSRLPLLAPMSDIAGRLSIQIGSNLLFGYNDGRGLLLGGVSGVERGNVVIIGAGVAGMNAARMAAGMGANVTVFDINMDALAKAKEIGSNVTALYSYPNAIAHALLTADLVVGAVLITGKKAPHVITEAMVKTMRNGSVIVDISVDQGGCIETTVPTTYASPTYVKHGVIHFCVTNMPGTVPYTSTNALSAAITPYVRQLAAGKMSDALHKGINVKFGNYLL